MADRLVLHSVKRNIALVAVIVAFAMLFVAVSPVCAEESTVKTYSKSMNVVGSGGKADPDFLYTVRFGEKGEVVSSTSSSRKVVEIFNDGSCSPGTFFAKKPGKATITFKVKKNGKIRKYKMAVKVFRHNDPFRKFTFAGKNLTKKYNRKTYCQFSSNKKAATVRITSKKGWKIKKITRRWYDIEANKEKRATIRNGSKIQLDSIYNMIVVDMYNSKNKTKQRFFAVAFNERAGIGELVHIEVPENYGDPSVTHVNGDTSRPSIEKTWSNESNDTIRASILSYNGTPVMGKEDVYPKDADGNPLVTMEDYRALGFEEKTTSNGMSVLVGTTDLGTVKDGAIRGVFEYYECLIAVGVENGENQAVTEKNITDFNQVLESASAAIPVPNGRPWRPKIYIDEK